MGGQETSQTVGDLFAASRRRLLVGRTAELALLGRFLDDRQKVMAYVHGPGGVGKTSVLDAFIADATDAGRWVSRLDCADLEPTVPGFLRAVHSTEPSLATGQAAPGPLLAIDRFESLAGLSWWFWRTFVPSLPADAQLVVAGRWPPAESWRTDPAFADRVVTLPIRNLAAGDAAELIRVRGVSDEQAVADLVRATYGHPLAIVITTDQLSSAVIENPSVRPPTGHGVLLDHPDAAARLLGRFLEDGVTPLQREALHVCGHARRVDRALLREVLDLDDTVADTLLSWLRERPYAESHPDGLSLHDVVRDALDRDLRWRDRDAFAAMHARIRTVVVERMLASTEAADHGRRAADLLHLHRGNPAAQQLYTFADLGMVVARPLRLDPEEVRWVADAFGAEHRSAAAVYWMREQPAAWTVFEDAVGRLVGLFAMLRLDQAGPEAARHDPVADWILHELARRRPPEPSEVVLHGIAIHADDPPHPGIVSDQAAALSLRAWQVRGLGWAVLSTAHEAGWARLFTYIGFERLGACTVDGTEIAVWARDFARSPYADWLAGLAAHELDEAGTAPPPVATPVALARIDFGAAVRQLLKDLHDPVRLRVNPLTGSHLVDGGLDPVPVLQQRVRRAIEALGHGARLQVAARVLDRTFVRPASTQEKAAELLGLPFSTYRRHLAAGMEQLEALLWDWELHGIPSTATEASANR